MKTLHIDIETYCAVDLSKTGHCRYASDPSFEILLIAYAYDNGPVRLIDLASGEIPGDQFIKDLRDPGVVKVAHNAAFERVCLASCPQIGTLYVDPFTRDIEPLPVEQWRCTMVHATELGMPASLKQLAIWLDTEYQKDASGTRLVNKFTKPSPKGGRLLPTDDPTAWEAFKAYCAQDVRTEQAIYKRLQASPLPDSEWRLWYLDQHINDRGFKTDLDLVEAAQAMDKRIRAVKIAELKDITGLDNPASVPQLSGWVTDHDVDLPNLLKATVQQAVKSGTLPDTVRQALELRLELSNASTKKYDAFLAMADDDSIIRGVLQFYGAARTGRWAGRGIQIQNLPRSELSTQELTVLRREVKNGSRQAAGHELKQLVRTAIVPRQGCRFLVSDFSAIEARILAWLSGERWVLEAFGRGEDLYKATAAKMFRTSVEEITKEQRAKGKIAVLACGYQGGVGALKRMGAEAMGLKEHEMERIVKQWRRTNGNSVRLWTKVERGAMHSVRNPGRKVALTVGDGQELFFTTVDGALFITLPSGRALAYQRPSIKNEYNLVFFSRGVSGAMTEEETYGGKLVENIVQAVARDVLAEALTNLDLLGYRTVAHVHDEVIIEAPNSVGTATDIDEILSVGAPWTKGLPLAAEGFESQYYRKGE